MITTAWQLTINMLQTMPAQQIQDRPQFKTATPEDVVKYMTDHPEVKTVLQVMHVMGLTKSTVKRILEVAVDDGLLRVDKTSHPRHFVYYVRG